MNIVLFEDDRVEQLFPVTRLRPAYTVTCGSLTLVDIAKSLGSCLSGVVRDYLAEFQRDYFEPAAWDSQRHPTLWLNARLVPDAELIPRIRELVSNGPPLCVQHEGQTMMALTGPDDRPINGPAPRDEVLECLYTISPVTDDQFGFRLIDYPHSLVGEHTRTMVSNLEFRLAEGDYQEIANGVFAKQPIRHDHVVFRTDAGPILIEQDVRIEPFTVVSGPTYLGANAFVASHSNLKGPISVGNHTKIGGEVSRTIMESYSNKVHFGYMGGAYIGSWVNLGAGTTNSNLKNTYGPVRMEYDGQKVDTGMQFLGCIIGDFTKTAIHTSIYTGKVLGVCSNVYGTVASNVPSFANYARSLGEVTEHPPEVMAVAQSRAFQRRGIEQENRHVELLQAAYQIEASHRKLANKPPSL